MSPPSGMEAVLKRHAKVKLDLAKCSEMEKENKACLNKCILVLRLL